MPEESLWATFFTPEEVLHKLGLSTAGDVVDFGCGYGTFTIPAAKITSGTVYALDIDPEMWRPPNRKRRPPDGKCASYVSGLRCRGTGLPHAASNMRCFSISYMRSAPILSCGRRTAY